MSDILKKVSFSFILKILSALLAYPTAVLLARQLGSDGYGIYGFVIALVGMMIYPVVLGQDQLVVRHALSVKEHFKRVKSYPLVGFSIKFVLVISIVVSLIVSAVSFYFPYIFGEFTLGICIGVWILPFFSARRILTGLFRAINKPVFSIFPETLIQPIIILVSVLIFINYSSRKISAEDVVFFQVFAYFLSCLVLIIVYKILQAKEKQLDIIKPTVSFNRKAWIKSGAFMALMATAEGFAMYLDRFMLGMFGPVSEVGIYLVAARNTGFVLFIESAFLLVTMPIIAKLYSEKKDVIGIVGLQSVFVFFFTLVFFLFFVFWGRWILEWFGPGFSSAYIVILILSSAYFLGSIFGAGPHILMMTGNEKLSSNIVLGTTIVNVGLNLILIPIWGILGAAIATFVSELLKKMISYWFIKNKLKIDISIFSLSFSKIKNSINNDNI